MKPTLIVLSHLLWGFVFQRPQHLLTRLAKEYDIIFVEEPVKGDDELITHETDNITVAVPHTSLDEHGFTDQQNDKIKELLVKFIAEKKIENYLVWVYTPLAYPIVEALSPDVIIYDCMDELSMFMGSQANTLREREKELLRVANVVFTGGHSIYQAKKEFNPNVICLPSAVDIDHYDPVKCMANLEEVNLANDLQKNVKNPCIGFFGVIDERLDIDLVKYLSEFNPNWDIVMVGPVVKIDPAILPKADNIHWLGQQNYKILPQLCSKWDVCILPFALNDSTKFISPTKTLEYMAAEKPIVSTAITDVKFAFSDVVLVADNHREFAEYCKQIIDNTDPLTFERITMGIGTVYKCTWDAAANIVMKELNRL